MMRVWLVALAALGLLAQPAAAQQRDPFNGQFGVIQLAPPPGEAARQATLMGEALAAIPEQRPGQVDVYILSVSLWSDPVFESEASQAAEILRAHFGDAAQGRTMILSAGGALGQRRYPAATPDNIAATLGRIGAAIDPNEDLVVLFMTSHGANDGSISLREHNRLAGTLRPANLRDMLASAAIYNRVVILSACFSGAFISSLADENTIVLTAAAHDRSSFGCQPQREWTFFGDALFDDSLRNDNSLLDAFDDATRIIARWEREQNLTPPSNPQRYVGSRGAELLRRAERNAR